MATGPACKLDYVLPWDQLARMVKQPLTSLSRRALSVITSLLRKGMVHASGRLTLLLPLKPNVVINDDHAVSLQDIDPATLSPVLELLAAFPLSDVPADLAAASSAATGSSVGSSTGIAQKSLLPQYLEASALMISGTRWSLHWHREFHMLTLILCAESSQTRQLFCRQQSYAPALLASFDDMDALRMLVKLYGTTAQPSNVRTGPRPDLVTSFWATTELERGALPPATRKLFLGAFCFSALCHAAEVNLMYLQPWITLPTNLLCLVPLRFGLYCKPFQSPRRTSVTPFTAECRLRDL